MHLSGTASRSHQTILVCMGRPSGSASKCGFCGQAGHNKTTCEAYQRHLKNGGTPLGKAMRDIADYEPSRFGQGSPLLN
eukprot:g71190.t1